MAELLVHAGRSAGVPSLREANAAYDQPLEVGDAVFALVVQPEGPPDAVRSLVGKDLTLKVIEVDQKLNRLILSRKAATQDLRRQKKARAAAKLHVGDVLDGTVTHVTGFGLFADVGIADGLIRSAS